MRSSRRCRSKSRKPKYVSLRLHLAPPPPPPPPPPEPSDMSSSAAPKGDCDAGRRHHQLDLFPLHPEHLDRDPHVACLLDDRVGCGQPTLAALLGCCGVSSSSRSPSPPSMNWEEAEEGGGDGDGLARRALRGRERWVYCRSSSAASSEEEVASSAAAGDCGGGSVDLWRCAAPQALALKLDYEEILAAWSDRGPLYMDGEGPQVVPQLHRSANPYDSAAFPVLVEVGGSGGGSSPWKVPEQRAWDGDGAEEKERSGMSREARLMRYKEKRGNRLFVKRIRYEVRKLNAEKRPRVKGRFVRRKDEDDEDHS